MRNKYFWHNEAFRTLIDAGIVDVGKLFDALEQDEELELNGPWQGSDYSGNDWYESNQRSLARDFPELLEDYTFKNGVDAYGLCINARKFGNPGNRKAAESLASTLAGLCHEYPIYDEEDHSALIEERARKAWEIWIEWDLRREISKQLGLEVDLSKHEEEFWETASHEDIWPEAEGHRDVTMRGIFDLTFLEAMARVAVQAGHVDVEDAFDNPLGMQVLGEWMAAGYPDEPRAWVMPGQLSLF